MAEPIEVLTQEGFSFEIMLLPRNSRTVTKRTITATVAANEGDNAITLASSATIVVPAGTALSFAAPSSPTERQLVVTEDDVTLTTTPQEIAVFPLKRGVAINSTATLVDGLLPLYGVRQFPFTGSDTTVDNTSTKSGTGTEGVIVRTARSYQVTLNERTGDPALQIIKNLKKNPAFIQREIYFRATRSNGEVFAGAAKIENLNEAGDVNGVLEASFNLMIQGDPEWTNPYPA